MLRLFIIIKATAINDLNFLNFVDESYEMFSKFKFCATVYEFWSFTISDERHVATITHLGLWWKICRNIMLLKKFLDYEFCYTELLVVTYSPVSG